MRILAIVQGEYGRRKVKHIKERGPSEWTVEVFEAPRFLPAIIDDPAEFVPQGLPPADLILSLGESPGAAQLIPYIVKMTGARAVIAPIDNSAWLPPGLKNQIQKELAEMGVASAFPKTFCTLTEARYGFRHAAESYNDDLISAFARHFGKPILKITVNPETRKIEEVEVVRGAPCGSTHHAAKGMIGMSVDEAVIKAGLICHHHPCLASMNKEQVDDRLYDTLMHVSGYVINEEVERHVKQYKKPPQYVVPGERLEEKES